MLRLPCAASRTPVLRLCARGRRPFLSFVAPSQSLVKSHRERKVVPFSCEQMYAVVADVDRYREFLPFCVDSRVLRQPNDNVMEAALRIGFRVFTESYTSRVLMVRPSKIVIRSIESPTFKRIESEWLFKPAAGSPDSCEIDFTVTFEVASYLHASAIQLFFDDVALTQLNAFVSRARKIYGPGNRARQLAGCCPIDSSPAGPEASSSNDSATPSTPPATCTAAAAAAETIVPTPMSRTRDELCEQAAQRIKGGISPESFDEFASIFRRYADADSQLDYRGFCCACGELGEVYQDFKDIRENSVISGAVFSTLETSERPHKDWLSLDDFVVGVYMMTKGTFEQKAHNLFHLIDSTGDGKISREELTRALRRRVETVRKIFPTLLRDQVQIQLELVQEQEGIDKAQLSAKSSQDAAIEKGVHALDALMVEIEAEIPLAVNQIFLEADLDQDDFIKEEEWLLAWQAHPEFVELLSIDGLKKVAQWAAVVRGGGDAPTGDDDSEDPSSIPDTRLTYVD